VKSGSDLLGEQIEPSEEPGTTCEECTHSLTLHDEDGFCTVSGCGCEGASDEAFPEAPLIRNDYGPDWWEDASMPRQGRRYRPSRLAVLWPFAGSAKQKGARKERQNAGPISPGHERPRS
jgi:hypothetical protein